jgi:lanthanide-dependent methanol dehydrogenase
MRTQAKRVGLPGDAARFHDYDEIMENVLINMDYGGRSRKLIVHPGRTGFVYVLDRETGELLSAETFQPINWASGYDLKTGKAMEDPAKQTHFGTVTHGICPSSTGAKDVIPSAFSPRTGLLYIPSHNTCMDYEGIEANYIAGTPYLGADVRMYPGPGGYQGELVAWDVARNRKAWGVKDPKFPIYSGVLATGGDVIFYGTMDGWFKALDARTGTELWKFHVASGIVANPITYLGPDGKQYVAVYSGIGGWMGAVAFPEISADDPYAALGVVGAMKEIKKYTAPGDVVYVFGISAGCRRLACARDERRESAAAPSDLCGSEQHAVFQPARAGLRERHRPARGWRAQSASRRFLVAAAARFHQEHLERRTM